MAKNILNVANFTIHKRLGTGARSTIYLATDKQSKTDVALKRIIYEKPEDVRVFEQVENEYKISQMLDHPYIRKCYKIKKTYRFFKPKELLLTMEFFDGVSLEDGPALSLVDVMLVFRMVASALNHMHQRNLIHCDMKPNNILMNKSGEIRIIDLGQSCRIGIIKQRIQGTPDYIAPEQVRRQALTPKTDIFNLGATMYWALTGHNVRTLIPKKKEPLNLILAPENPAPHEIKKQLPLSLSDLVMLCVKENPEDRPSSMNIIISKLDRIIHSLLGDKIKKKNE